MSSLYAIAGLDGAAPKPAASEPEATGKRLGQAGWSSTSDQSKRFQPTVVRRPAAGAAGAKPKAPAPPVPTASGPSAGVKGAASTPTNATSWYKDIKTPYDPAHPNDYDEWVREQEIKAKQKRLDEDLQRKLASASAAGFDRPGGDEDPKRQRTGPPPPPPQRDPPPPPPRQPAAPPPPPPRQPAAPPPPPLPEGFSAAGETGEPGVSMLQKMGWSEGQGLGKQGQGMKTPLVAKKMDATTGVITNAEHKPLSRPPPPPPPLPAGGGGGSGGGAGAAASGAPGEGGGKKTGAVTFRGRPSRVLLMKNMVGKGEVDEDLVGEIGEECSKYGEVAQVTVFEVKDGADEEAVRIFVKFGKQAAAMKAYIDLDGRFFGGRHVWVCFFKEADFDAGSLAPSASEPR